MQIEEKILEELLARASEQGAQKVITELGLDRDTVKDMQNFLSALSSAKKTVWNTVVKLITYAFFGLLMVGAGYWYTKGGS